MSEPNVKVEFLDQSEKALVKFRAEVLGDLLECAVQFRLSDRFRFQIPFHELVCDVNVLLTFFIRGVLLK